MDRRHRHRNPIIIGGRREPRLKLLLAGMRREDPPKNSKLAIPIDVIDWLLTYYSGNQGLKHIAKLCAVAFSITSCESANTRSPVARTPL